jgi:hypothetical protein
VFDVRDAPDGTPAVRVGARASGSLYIPMALNCVSRWSYALRARILIPIAYSLHYVYSNHTSLMCIILKVLPRKNMEYGGINRQKPTIDIRHGNEIEARVFATVCSFVILRWCHLYARS